MTRHSLSAIAFVFAVNGATLGAQSAPLPVEQTSVSEVASVSPSSLSARTDSIASVFITAHPAGLFNTPAIASHLTVQDTVRRKAVTYSDWYARRLRVHRYGSYAMLPLFVTQYVLGKKLLDQKDAQYAGTRFSPIDDRLRNTHVAIAATVGALFVVNTTTGLWNLFESRHTVEGRKLRRIHAITMLLADAGFAYTGLLGSDAEDHGPTQARKHRNAGLVSFGIATAGTSLMWFGRN